MKFTIDTARNIAYRGSNGYFIDYDEIGLYVEKGLKKIYLEPKKIRIMEEERCQDLRR